jgi:DNA-binding NarL/FixJ family response regulator
MTAPAVTPGRLNEHQLAILRLVANGLTARQIARRIGRSYETVAIRDGHIQPDQIRQESR